MRYFTLNIFLTERKTIIEIKKTFFVGFILWNSVFIYNIEIASCTFR